MAGLSLDSGIGLRTSVVSGMYPSYGGASVPGKSTVPEGPATITQSAFGVPGAGGGGRKGLSIAAIGTFALAGLVFLWWSLPR